MKRDFKIIHIIPVFNVFCTSPWLCEELMAAAFILWVIYSNSPSGDCCAPGVTASHRFLSALYCSCAIISLVQGLTERDITIWMLLWLLVMPIIHCGRFLSIRELSSKFQQKRRAGNFNILERSGWGHKYTPIQRVRQLRNTRALQLKLPRSCI